MGNKSAAEIRFPGFYGDWVENRLGELYDIYSGQTPLRSDYSNFENPKIAWIKTTDLNNKSIKFNEENISEKAAEKLKILKKDTVLIAMYGGFNQIGRTGILTYPATINQALSALEPIKDVKPYFLITELNFRVNEWRRLAASSRKDPNITKNDVENFVLNYPSLEEQTQISNFFKQLDDTITLHQQELNILKQTKQGFLQKMFPKESESVPEIRFPGFTGNWEERKLGDHAEILTGGTPDTQVKEYWEPKEIPWMSSGEINKKRLLSTDNMISKLGFDKSSARWVQENSVLIALAGQGKTRGTVAINEIPLTTNQSIAAVVPKGELHHEFVFQNLGKRYEELRLISSGDGTRGGLNKQLVSDVEIMSPSIQEQIQIGNFFKKLDDTITLHQRELELLKQTKKAFLQKMFV